jgi:hypothetical protein
MSYLLSLVSLVLLLLLSSLSSANDFKSGFIVSDGDCPRYYSGSINNKYEIYGYLGAQDNWIRGWYGYVSQFKSGKGISLANDTYNSKDRNNLFEGNKKKDSNYFRLDYYSDLFMEGVWVNGKTKESLPFEWSIKPGTPIKIGAFSKNGITVNTYRTEMSLSHHVISISINGGDIIPVAQGDCYETFIQSSEVRVLDSKNAVIEVKLSSKTRGNGGHVTEINTLFVGVDKPEIKAWSNTHSGSGGQSFSHESIIFDFEGEYLVNITTKISSEDQIVEDGIKYGYLRTRTIDKYSIESNNELNFVGRQIEEFNERQLDEPSKVLTFNASEVSPSRLIQYGRLFPGYEK